MTGSSRRKAGLRRGRLAVVGALAATAVMAFGVASAQAAPQPFKATFDDAALNVGVTFDILDPPATATIERPRGPAPGTTSTNAVNVPANDFVFPSFTGTRSRECR